MNQINLSRLILPLLFVPLAIIAIINLLTGGGNQLGNTFFLLILFAGAMGLLAPRVGLLVFIVLQFYVDFLKRLLVLGDTLSNQDVMISLGMGPVIVVMACVNITLQCITGKIPFFNKRDIIYFSGCVGVSLAGLALSKDSPGSGGFAAIAQSLLGSSMLGMTAYASYAIIRDKADQHKVLKYIVLGAVPMAMYTFYQRFVGISGWEEEYIRTGLSRVLYSFYLIDGIDDMRPFSTLNTHTTVGAVSGVMFLIAALLMTRAKGFFGVSKNYRWFYLAISLVFIGSCYLSKNRTTYALPIFGLVLVFLFNGGWRTLLFYASSLAFFVWIVINSEWINDSILGWSAQLESTAFGKAFGSLGTYQARLTGFMQLTEPTNWKPFGLNENSTAKAHDMITETLLKVGYVPLFFALMIGATIVSWWHRKCLKIHQPDERKFMITLTAIIVSLGVCSLAYGNLLFVAPVNSLLGIMIGLGMSTIRRDQVEKKAAASAATAPRAIANPASQSALKEAKT
ncbi:MAG: hypothetical protein HC845_06295 [Akkermansiaceae bacterium]|nr:hypothetical protein [Akkermansiaceae bacterium]